MNRTTIFLKGILLASAMVLAFSCTSSKDVPYEVVKNYFFRNDAEIPASPMITTQEQFDSLFGAAAFMGKDGQPTHIDFDRQSVIAVVLPENYIETTLRPLSLTRSGGTLTFTYEKEENDTMSYTIRPVLLVATDKADGTEKVVLKCEFRRYSFFLPEPGLLKNRL